MCVHEHNLFTDVIFFAFAVCCCNIMNSKLGLNLLFPILIVFEREIGNKAGPEKIVLNSSTCIQTPSYSCLSLKMCDENNYKSF